VLDRNRPLRIITTVLAATGLVTGCSSLTGDDGTREHSVSVGTTSAPSVLDPAAAWDGSWELYKNVYQTLLSFPASGSEPEPDAAQHCGFTDSQSKVYRCVMRKGLAFSNGHPLDAAAVKHSIDRIRAIKAPSGPLGLLGSLDRVQTPDKRTVVFHLKKSDATFPYILATPATALVDPAVYPEHRLHKGNSLVGSGPYTLTSYQQDQKAELVKNAHYRGPAKIRNDAVTINYYQRSSQMVSALKHKKIDLVLRGLTPDEVTGFQKEQARGEQGIQLSALLGTEIRYLVFNARNGTAANPAVRKAIAQLIDRKSLVRKVYKRTADPLYSMVPGGIAGHASAFYDAYGDPSRTKAAQTLSKAGIKKKVPLTLWYTTDRYGSATAREFAELKRQLNASGLFSIKVKGRPWNQFQKDYNKGKYPVFGRGWFPDYPDADDYVTPFVGAHNAMGTPYENARITQKLLPRSRKEGDRAVASRDFTTVQRLIANDARLLPLWQGRLYLASLKDIAGTEWVLDPSALPRLWELHEKTNW
jgi:peptide/nickel transport system substrate-binding protein